jgi:hypothetical protein
MTWLKTWMVAFSHGIRLPLCQILEVVWMGIGFDELLRADQGMNTIQGNANRWGVSRRRVDWWGRRGNRVDNDFENRGCGLGEKQRVSLPLRGVSESASWRAVGIERTGEI